MHTPRPIAAMFLALAATALGAQTFVLQPTQTTPVTESHSIPLANGSNLSIKNVNGRIKVEAWDRAEVEFKGEFKPSSKNEQVKVVFDANSAGLEIRGEYPKPIPGMENYRGASCEMELKVPRKIMAKLDTVNGRITISGIEGSVECHTVNGAIEARNLSQGLIGKTVNGALSLDQVQGRIEAATINGAITGKGLDGMGKGIELSTVNGALNIEIAKLEGSLHASTVHGQLSVNTKGAEQVNATKHQVEATFPGSKQTIHLSTVNGAVVMK